MKINQGLIVVIVVIIIIVAFYVFYKQKEGMENQHCEMVRQEMGRCEMVRQEMGRCEMEGREMKRREMERREMEGREMKRREMEGREMKRKEIPCQFDARRYADAYPDLKNAFGYNEDQLRGHYVNYGIREGRSPCGIPSCSFDHGEYYKYNPDVKAAGMDAAQHFKQYGIKEGRLIRKCTR